jgi:hypothetical protein
MLLDMLTVAHLIKICISEPTHFHYFVHKSLPLLHVISQKDSSIYFQTTSLRSILVL